MPLLTKPNTRFVYLKKKVPALTYTALAADLAQREHARGLPRERPGPAYPGGTVGAVVVGFVDADGKGLAGLELPSTPSWPGWRARRSTRARRTAARSPRHSSVTPAHNGLNFQLTIDSELQWVAEQRLAWPGSEQGADSGIRHRDERQDRARSWPWPTRPTFDSDHPPGGRDRRIAATGPITAPTSRAACRRC